MPISSRLPRIDISGLPFHEVIFKSFKQYGNQLAMINSETEQRFTFTDLIEKARFVASALVYLGVEKGEVVMMCMDNSPEAVFIFLGISMAGAAASTISPRLHSDEMRDQIISSDTRFLFVDPIGLAAVDKVFAENIREHRIIYTGSRDTSNGYPILKDLAFAARQTTSFPAIYPHDDMVYLPYSSGIHGARKGIVTTHYVMNVKTATAYNPRFYVHPGKGEYTVAMLPFHKQLGLETIILSLLNGAVVVTVAAFRVSTMLRLIQMYKVKTLNVSPLMMSIMIKESHKGVVEAHRIPSLVTVVTGTAPVTKTLYDDFREAFPSVKHILSTYGMTEVGMITRSLPSKEFTSSCGTLAAGISLKVIDLISGRELGANQKGLIFVQGECAMSPYLNNEEATREVMHNGWRKTGDIGYYDNSENVYIVDKTKDMIKVHGYQVIPTELESILMSHAAVKEAVVVPIDDAEAGERPVAFVVIEPGHLVSPEKLKDYVNERVVRYKRLVQVNIAQTLPRSPCGTPLRRLLAEAAVLSVFNLCK